jgi:hypothetical protein
MPISILSRKYVQTCSDAHSFYQIHAGNAITGTLQHCKSAFGSHLPASIRSGEAEPAITDQGPAFAFRASVSDF